MITVHIISSAYLMIWAAMTLAFFGFHCLGKLTCNCKFNSSAHLTKDNIAFHPGKGLEHPSFMTVHITETNTDPFRKGHTITVGSIESPLCPIFAMKKYLSQRSQTIGPLFIHTSGKPLMKQTLTLETQTLLTQAGFNATKYAGHSYRIGAATTAAFAKLATWLIKTLGRWSSDCFKQYIKTPISTLSGVSATLVKVSKS